ncbi:hypothetical protein ACHMW6_17535 [Pseudoduganella sp. UC29_106]|uniref:hypothetical protein n=1 Tax=Pseudoduganella sp. UC29_106 TaxID=3374553 RepID=UPI0037571492
MSKSVKWRKKPQKKDYPAALAYLSLVFNQAVATRLVGKLRRAKVKKMPARDILRAAHTPMAEVKAFDWTSQNKAIKKGRRFSPILLVCGVHSDGDGVVIADGFHRLCAAFDDDQDAVVLFKIA